MKAVLDVRVDSIAAGGDGVGRHEGLVVFTPRTAPGDVARVEGERRDRFLRGRMLELLVPSVLRIEPPCEHYVRDGCGGCQLQHLRYAAQVEAKAMIIRDAMNRIGGLALDAPEMTPSDGPWRYRRKLTLALRRKDGDWIAGLHRFDAPSEIFRLRDCPITDKAVVDAWKLVLAQRAHLPAAPALRGAVRLLDSGFSFSLEGGRSWPARDRFCAAVPTMSELWWAPEGQSRRLVQSHAAKDQAGASFTQVNSGVALALREWVLTLAARSQPATAIDAYAGTGDIAVGLAKQGSRVTAIEIDRDAARLCAGRLPKGSRAVAGAVEDHLAEALPADLVILNPPRAGVHERVTSLLAQAAADTGSEPAAAKSIIYVSCNPATLARDVRRLVGFRVRSIRGFDMFPQTAHVETVCELTPAA